MRTHILALHVISADAGRFTLDSDACKLTTRAVLVQESSLGEVWIAYASCALDLTEHKFGITSK